MLSTVVYLWVSYRSYDNEAPFDFDFAQDSVYTPSNISRRRTTTSTSSNHTQKAA